MKGYNTLVTFTNALKFASFKHRNQKRKDQGSPYINHPIEVANILAEAGITDYQILSAAILHDTIEDTDTTREELSKQFGERITNLVLECSDDKSLSKVERKRVQIYKASKSSTDAKLIKIADKLSNCKDMERYVPVGWSKQRVEGYYLWAYAVCRNLKSGNQLLDKSMEQLFAKLGVTMFDGEVQNKRLQEYYVILSQSKGQK